MICPNCKKEIEDNKIFCPYCQCDVQEALKDKKEKKSFMKKLLPFIIAVILLLTGLFVYSGITQSPQYIKKQFINAVESADLDKALSYTTVSEDKFFGLEELKAIALDIDEIQLTDINDTPFKRKLDLSKHVQYVEIILPKDSELIFEGVKMTDISGTANKTDEIYTIGYVLTGNYTIDIKAPNTMPLHSKNSIVRGTSPLDFINRLYADRKSDKQIRETAVDIISKLYLGAAVQKDFNDLELPKEYLEGRDNLLNTSYDALKGFFTDGAKNDRFVFEDFKINSINADAHAKSTKDSQFSTIVDIDYSYTFHNLEDDTLTRDNKKRSVTVDLVKENDKWIVTSFYIPAFMNTD